MLESKKRALIFLTLSIIFAGIAGVLILNKVQDLQSELGGMTEVYIANTDISSRELIISDHITMMELPNRFVTESHITELEHLDGKVSVVPLSEGNLITHNMLRDYSNVTEDGNRIVALYSSDKIHFDQELEVMDRIDIVVSHGFEGESMTEVFMEDVPVAMVSREGNSFSGVAVEVSLDAASELIHMQNFASSLRILKANVGTDGISPLDNSLEENSHENGDPEQETDEESQDSEEENENNDNEDSENETNSETNENEENNEDETNNEENENESNNNNDNE
ncbi:SAF domain-containing protein [Salipaludibacillus daqingensis]|uniref:SAF domain-containing protein n=1 Tax=Salipaludibacillus daqingensis TaxID=3041001 RepID=UPI00247539F7|nr:SAF domain-containing protein [Salipaludibacillus daqingensis]